MLSKGGNNEILAAWGEGNGPNASVFGAFDPADQALHDEAIDSDAQRFSWWMTSLLHRFEHEPPFDLRRQLAELHYVMNSRAAAMTLAENYVGLPLDA